MTEDGRELRASDELRAGVLAYLQGHPGEASTGKQGAVAFGAWPPPTRRALARLADFGTAELVSKDPS
jgi:hypothetical protein